MEQRQRVRPAKVQCQQKTKRAFRRTRPLCLAALVPFVPFVAIAQLQKVPVERPPRWHETSVAVEASAEEAQTVVAAVADTVVAAAADTVVAAADIAIVAAADIAVAAADIAVAAVVDIAAVE